MPRLDHRFNVREEQVLRQLEFLFVLRRQRLVGFHNAYQFHILMLRQSM